MKVITESMMPLATEAVDCIEGSGGIAVVEISADGDTGAISVTVPGATKPHEVHATLHALFRKYCAMSHGHYSVSIVVVRP